MRNRRKNKPLQSRKNLGWLSKVGHWFSSHNFDKVAGICWKISYK